MVTLMWSVPNARALNVYIFHSVVTNYEKNFFYMSRDKI
jgi:hypothetical protein